MYKNKSIRTYQLRKSFFSSAKSAPSDAQAPACIGHPRCVNPTLRKSIVTLPHAPIFIPNRQNFPHPYALKSELSQPSTPSSPKKHRATQPTTSTTTTPKSFMVVTPIAMAPVTDNDVATSSLPPIMTFATYDDNSNDSKHTQTFHVRHTDR